MELESGSDQTFTITPESGSGYNIVEEVLVDGAPEAGYPAQGETTFEFTNVTADHQLSVTFDDHGSSGCDDTATDLTFPAVGSTG